jgi:hypothetical protein
MIWLLPRPLPPLPSVNSTDDKQEDWEREITCWQERGWGGGAKSYDDQTAWSSINHSILSDPPQPLSTSRVSVWIPRMAIRHPSCISAIQPYRKCVFFIFGEKWRTQNCFQNLIRYFTYTVFLSASKFSLAVFRIILAILRNTLLQAKILWLLK